MNRSVTFASPQGQREKSWRKDVSATSASISSVGREDLVAEGGHDSQIYEGELGRLRRENASLKDQIQRTFRELKAYQVKYPSYDIPQQVLDNDENLPPWSTTPELMTPLLEAYDLKIRELEHVANQQSIQLDVFREKVQVIVRENDELRDIQLEHMKQLSQHGDTSSGRVGPLSTMGSELIDELNERIDILMSENSLVVEQKSLLQQELDEFQTTLQTRTEELSEVSDKATTLATELHEATRRLQQAEKDREEAAAQALSYSESLGKAEDSIEAAEQDVANWKNSHGEMESKYLDMQSQVKHIKSEQEAEALESMRRVRKAEDRVRELHAQLLQKTQELDASSEVLRKLRREYQTTRQDAEGMLQVMTGLERQVADYSSRESDVQRLVREGKEKIEDALAARDTAITKQEQLKREIDRLVEERKDIAVRRQADLDATSEVVRLRGAEQLRACERDLDEMAERNATLLAENEKVLRETKSTKEEADRAHQSLENERRATEHAMKEMHARLNELAIQKEEESSKKFEVQELNTDYRLTIDKLRNQVDSMTMQFMQLERTKETDSVALRTLVRELQRDATEKSRALLKAQKDLDDLREQSQVQIQDLERKLGDENSMIRRRIHDADRVVKEMEQELTVGGQRTHDFVQTIKEKASTGLRQMETQLKEESQLAKAMAARSRELEARLGEVGQEKMVLQHAMEGAKESIGCLQEELQASRVAVADLSLQLSESYSARDLGAQRAARVIESMTLGSSSEYGHVGMNDWELGGDETVVDKFNRSIARIDDVLAESRSRPSITGSYPSDSQLFSSVSSPERPDRGSGEPTTLYADSLAVGLTTELASPAAPQVPATPLVAPTPSTAAIHANKDMY
jgi:myosin protein heavy chain